MTETVTTMAKEEVTSLYREEDWDRCLVKTSIGPSFRGLLFMSSVNAEVSAELF